jgi:hypothetical protein
LTKRVTSNNATTTLSAGITASATSLSVTGGSLFSSLSAGQSFTFTLIKAGNTSVYEICLCTGISGNNFTSITRAREGTTALSWNSGDTVAAQFTADDYAQCTQFDDLQAQLGNYAADVGSANAYSVTLSPALTAYVGSPIRWKAAHASTGASTFNAGPGAQTLVLQDGSAITTQIAAGGIYECVWDGTHMQLQYPDLSAYLTTTAAASTYAPQESPPLTGIPTAPTAAAGSDTAQIANTAFVQTAVAGTGTLASPGYAKLPSGLILQWGIAGPSPGLGTTATVYFPLTFPNGCLSVQATAISYASQIYVSSPVSSATSFQLLNGQAGGYTSWFAVGH